MEKIKQIAKYTTNILAIIASLVAGINAVEGITIPYAIQIVQVIAVIQGVIGTYLLGNKAIEVSKENETNQVLQDEMEDEEIEIVEEEE